MFKLRDIPPGQAIPKAAVVTRTGRSLEFQSKQVIVRFPLWASHRTLYDIRADEFVTCWWARIIQLSFERGIATPVIGCRLAWGDVPIFQREKSYEPKPLVG